MRTLFNPISLFFLGALSVSRLWAQPVITTQPVSQVADLGATVTFSVSATDTEPLSYQWQLNGTAVDLATSATLTLSNVTAAEAGSYTVYVYDPTSAVTSAPATLTLTGGPVISSRLTETAYAQTIPFLYTITASNAPTNFGATGLPTGLSVDAQTGVISGTPTATGAFQITLTASNSSGTNSATLSLTVSPPPYTFSTLNVVPNVPFSSLAGIVRGGPNLFYVADSGNSTIYQFNPATQTATVWVGTTGVTGTRDGVGSAALFNNPTGLAIDGSGNVYVADTANSTIRKISSTGAVATLAGVPGEPGAADGVSSVAHFNYPQGVAVDSSGNVYVADTGNYSIRKISPSGTVTTIGGAAGSGGNIIDGPGPSSRFANPRAIVVDSKENLFVGDGDLLVREISTSDIVSTVTKVTYGLSQEIGNLAIDSSDNLYFIVPEIRGSDMEEVTPGGDMIPLGPLSPTGVEDFYYVPSAMAFDPSGHIYATSGANISEGVVAEGPTIVSQPTITESGQTATLSVAAKGLPTDLSYEWLLNGVPVSIPGENIITFSLNAETVGTYSVLITNNLGGAVLSNGVRLTLAPVISSQPSNQAVSADASATFSVAASGTTMFTYQWTYNGTAIAGATSASYTISDSQVSNSGAYAVTVTDPDGSVTSQSAFLTVNASSGGPTIQAQPQSSTTDSGGTVVFTVTMSSAKAQSVASPPTTHATLADTYQWYFNGSALSPGGGVSGAQTSTLIISGAASQAGSYICLIENSAGSVVSTPADLTVSQSSDMGRLINVSCRAVVGTGPNFLIAGFTVGGSGTSGSEPVLIRASGPALVPFDLPDTLPDPDLQLYNVASGIDLLATNTGWGGNTQITSTAVSVGAFAWANPSSHDSALLENLVPGPYTANISGKTGDSGVALAEVYDATSEGTYVLTTPRLINISARVQVGTGGNILIAGFVIGGTTSKTLLIRASGPALIPFGVTGILPDPQLQLYRSNSNGASTLLGTNTGWGGNPQIAAEAALVGAFSWGNSSTADSALLVTLPPGGYTAQVSGVSGSTGIALMEVYEVP